VRVRSTQGPPREKKVECLAVLRAGEGGGCVVVIVNNRIAVTFPSPSSPAKVDVCGIRSTGFDVW
jgi:hypothetical protein